MKFRLPRLAAFLPLAFLLLSAACGGAQADVPASPPPSTSTAFAAATILPAASPVATVTPSAALDEALKAYHLLLEKYIDPVDSSAVLMGGWNGAREAALRAGATVFDVQAPDFEKRPPSFEASPADEVTFRGALERLMAASGSRSPPIELARGAIDGMARSFKDDHTYFRPPADWRRVQQIESATLGVTVLNDPLGSLVYEVVPGFPAEAAGVRIGDIIKPVIGVPILATSLRAGVSTTLKVIRPGAGELELKVTPDARPLPMLETRMLPGKIAYVRVHTYPPGNNKDLRDSFVAEVDKQLGSLQQQGPEGWVLDLRSNPGGHADSAAHLAFKLGFTGRFLWFTGRPGVCDFAICYSSTSIPQTPVTNGKPPAVLVNRSSFSASEVTAADFQESKLGRVIGVQTGGSFNFAQLVEVGEGGLSITTGRLFTGVNRRQIDRVGMTPDDIVELKAADLAQGHDAQLDRAIAYLQAGR